MLPSRGLDRKSEISIWRIGWFLAWANFIDLNLQLIIIGLDRQKVGQFWFGSYCPSGNNMRAKTQTIQAAALVMASILLTSTSQAVLVIAGVTDGDLSGGNPKSIILQAGAPVADLSVWGVGSANNGGGSDGEEFTLPAGSAAIGDVFVIVPNADSFDFFANNFVQDFTLYLNGAANINGDDAIELFSNGAVFDIYGDIDVNGDGETWDYSDGFAVRTGGNPGAFNQANYASNAFALDGLSEQQHIDAFAAAGFTPLAVPEPSAVLLLGFAGLGLLRRRR